MARPDPVKAALAQAEEEARTLEAQTSSQTTAVAPAAQQGGAVAAAQPGQRRSLADLAANAAFAVDFYFGVDDLGLKVGKDKSRRDYVDVELKFSDMKGGWIIRANSPQGVKYFQSYDGATEARSRQSWEQVVARAQQMDGNAYVSDLIELPVTLLNPISDLKDGKPIKAGSRGGVSISYMNFKEFSGWFADQYARHGADAKLRVRIGFKAKTGAGNSDYGVYTWENLDEVEAAQAA